MTSINIKAFRGKVPRVSERLLQPSQAKRADNCKISSGRIDPIAGLQKVFSNSHTINTAYRYRVFRNNAFETNWLTWSDDVDVVPSLIPTDTEGRFYFTGAGYEPRMSTYSAAINNDSYPDAWFALGVTPPAAAPTVVAVGGSGAQETRAYVSTFVTAFGEESGPSAPSEVITGYTNSTWTVSDLSAVPTNSGVVSAAVGLPNGRTRVTVDTTYGVYIYDTITIDGTGGIAGLNASHRVIEVVDATHVDIALETTDVFVSGGTWSKNAPHNVIGMTRRIYRTTGTSGDFLFVAEISAGDVTFVDAVVADDLGEVIPTAASLPPPKNLTCLISLPNGTLAGLANNELCLSEPYMPYSWPLSNRYSFSSQGVALVAAGNSIVVLTDTYPILFTGTDPEAMSPSTMETYAPCVSKRGVVNAGGAAIYPSFDGLWLAGPGRVEKLTAKLYREEEWAQLHPETFDAAFHDSQYFAAYRGAEENRIFVLNVLEPDSVVEVDEVVDCLYRNEVDGKLYAAKGNELFVWDSDQGRAYDVDWISADVQMSRPTNFSVAQVHADYSSIVPVDTTQLDANTALVAAGPDSVAGYLNGNEILSTEINGSFLVPVELDSRKQLQFTIYYNGQPYFTRNVDNMFPFRLPAGFKCEVANVGVRTSIKVYSITVAQTVDELAQVSA